MRLIKHKKNIHSQNGEDGILGLIFSKLDGVTRWCVEFGAWDGKHLSNTFALVEKGWNAVYIEGDEIKYDDLLATVNLHKNIIPINAMVQYEGSESLSALLEKTSIPSDYDLLSIDIDSYDLAVWSSYNGNPKVVVIEINSTIRPGVDQWHDGKLYFGNSFSSTLDVAKKKGYELVCHTGNMIFVRNDLVHRIGIPEIDLCLPERLFLKNWLPWGQRIVFSLSLAIKSLRSKYKCL